MLITGRESSPTLDVNRSLGGEARPSPERIRRTTGNNVLRITLPVRAQAERPGESEQHSTEVRGSRRRLGGGVRKIVNDY